jgi:hypothetical protein
MMPCCRTEDQLYTGYIRQVSNEASYRSIRLFEERERGACEDVVERFAGKKSEGRWGVAWKLEGLVAKVDVPGGE